MKAIKESKDLFDLINELESSNNKLVFIGRMIVGSAWAIFILSLAYRFFTEEKIIEYISI